jgi:hypothetical protein
MKEQKIPKPMGRPRLAVELKKVRVHVSLPPELAAVALAYEGGPSAFFERLGSLVEQRQVSDFTHLEAMAAETNRVKFSSICRKSQDDEFAASGTLISSESSL